MPINDIKNLKPAKRYANALFKLKDLSAIKTTLKELEDIERIFFENPDLREFLEHPIISIADKKDALKKIFEGKIASDIADFLYVLVDENRINIFEAIIQCLKDEYSAKMGITQANVKSAVALDENEKSRLKTALKEKLGMEVQVEYEIEPSLIGGFCVNIQDKIIDLSVKSKFEQLKKLSKRI